MHEHSRKYVESTNSLPARAERPALQAAALGQLSLKDLQNILTKQAQEYLSAANKIGVGLADLTMTDCESLHIDRNQRGDVTHLRVTESGGSTASGQLHLDHGIHDYSFDEKSGRVTSGESVDMQGAGIKLERPVNGQSQAEITQDDGLDGIQGKSLSFDKSGLATVQSGFDVFDLDRP